MGLGKGKGNFNRQMNYKKFMEMHILLYFKNGQIMCLNKWKIDLNFISAIVVI